MYFKESLKMSLKFVSFFDKSAGHDIDPVPTFNINAGSLYNEGEHKDTEVGAVAGDVVCLINLNQTILAMCRYCRKREL